MISYDTIMTYKNLTRIFLFFACFFLFTLSFLNQHTLKGTLHADEPGVVLTSLSKNRNLYSIYKDVAYSSQPPLEIIIREKIYTPIGYFAGRIAYRFPELFHRSESLAWWLLPITFFFIYYNRFSAKNKYLVYLSFFLLVSSDFIGFYLAEAKHYSAIGAAFALTVVSLFQDKIPVRRRLNTFLLVSAVIPLLHMASFLYYFLLNLLVFVYLWTNSSRKERVKNIKKLAFWTAYIAFIAIMYLDIKRISTDYQHPSVNNILDISAVNEYIKWTLDWAFFKTPLYFLFNAVPKIIKDNLLFVLPLSSIPALYKTGINIFKKQHKPRIHLWFLITIFFFWPVNIVLFRYFAGMFSGERYSIGIIVVIFFTISYFATELVWAKVGKDHLKHTIMAGSILVCAFFGVRTINFNFILTTPESSFISQNRSLLNDANNVVIVDNGSHVHALSLLARIRKVRISSEMHYCTFGEFYIDNKNTLNEWLAANKSKDIYIFTAPRAFMNADQVVWKDQNRVLYKLRGLVPQQELCVNPQDQKECYLSCLKGYPVSTDGRSVPGMVPHIDVYRK